MSEGIIVNTGFAGVCERSVFLSWDVLGVDEAFWNKMSYQEKKDTLEEGMHFFMDWQRANFMPYKDAINLLNNGAEYIARKSWCGRYIGMHEGRAVLVWDGQPKNEAEFYQFTQDDLNAKDWYLVEY